jgi:hypothetical protein
MILPTGPDHYSLKRKSIPSLKVHPASIVREIGNDELTAPNVAYDPVANLLAEMLFVHPDSIKTAVGFDGRHDSVVEGFFHVVGECHSDKPQALDTATDRLHYIPALPG